MKIDPKTKLFTDFSLNEARQMVVWAERILSGKNGVFDSFGKVTQDVLEDDWVRLWSAYESFGDVSVLETVAGPRAQRSFVARVLLSVIRNFPVDGLHEENAKLRAWVDDLQSEMYINCVYCGHCYGPQEDTPTSMADVLTAHVEVCPKHPLSVARARIAELEAQLGIS